MNSNDAPSFNKSTWSVIESYFALNQGEAVVKYVLDSFNDFIHRKIDQIIEGFNPINIHHKYIPEKDMFEYQLTIEIRNPILTKPMINEKDGSTKIMTPNDARQRNFTYAGTLYVDVDFHSAVVKDGTVHHERKTIKKVNIGKIPIMLRSNYCILREPWYQNQRQNDECNYDYGGYFIVNGNEKVIVSQDRISENKTYVFLDNKLSSYSHIAEIRSVPDNTFGPPKLTSLKLSMKPNLFGRFIRVSVHHIRHDVPLCIIFRALGLTSDKEIIEHIVYDMDMPISQKIANELKGSIDEGSSISTPNQALEYLSRYLNISGYPKEILQSREHRLNIIRDILRNEFLPHVGEDYSKKSLYLGYMVNRLFKAYLNITPLDDRDSYINKRVDTPGVLMANLFRQYYGKLMRDMKTLIYKEVNSGPWKANNAFLNVVNTNNIYKIMKSTTIESGLKYSLSTGNWGIRNNINKTKQGVAQVLNRLTYNATLSHLRRINTPMEKTGKLIQPRKLHPTQWGIICPAETPEGGSVGLVKNLSIMTFITVSSNHAVIRDYARELGVVFYEAGMPLREFAVHTQILINGDLIGIHKDPRPFYVAMKDLKVRGLINIYTAVSWDIIGNVISICTDGGRCVRPLYIVDETTKDIRLTMDILNGINERKLNWNDVITPNASHNAATYGLTSSLVEYLDVEESNLAMIAMRYKDLSRGAKGHAAAVRYTHLEMHPSLILGVLASNIPFPEHNQAPRNCYQCIWEEEPVLMADGSRKAIRDVCVGDEVVCFDEVSMTPTTTKVIHQFCRPTDKIIHKLITVSGRSIVLTADHLVMTNQGWLEAKDIANNGAKVAVFMDVSMNSSSAILNEYCRASDYGYPTPELIEVLGSMMFVPLASDEIQPSCIIADITVESEHHSFIAGNNFAVHNCSMGKQAIGLYATNFHNRMDTLANVLNYPQKPLVTTMVSKFIHSDDMPSGINVIVAIMTFTGYNQEDSIIMNKSAVERGLFNSTFYRSYKEHCVKNHSTGEEEVFCTPPPNTKGVKPYNYDKIEEDGFVKENTYVEAGDVLIGKCMPQKINDTFVYKDNSVIVKNNEMGYIDRNGSHDRYFKNINSDGYVFAKVRVRNFRSPVVGDKLASKCAQKGTIGMLYKQEDMPFSQDGIVPDIIINPHCLAEDHEILTEQGFMNWKEVQAAYNSGTLRIAGYNHDMGELVYETPTAFILNEAKEQEMIEFKSPDGVNLLVTTDHDMFAKTTEEYQKCPASSLLTATSAQFLSTARKGSETALASMDLSETDFWTSSIRYRDTMVCTILEAGFSPSFAPDNNGWRVSYRPVEPVLQTNRDIQKRLYKGLTWCVTMPHGFIWTRRAVRNESTGIVSWASRPIITGQCIPSRMTIGQLMECILGKACVAMGATGDSTPFNDISVEDISKHLDSCGMERYGNEVMYNPRTGEQMPTTIFMGPTYYQRLKHMVADKSHSRNSNGPVVLLTRQPAEGRAREGGLRMGEMEVECNWAHGTLNFLKERLMECSDNYRVYVCGKCGMMANVNPDKNIYMCRPCQNNTDFVQIRIPYACKLLFQEIQCMGIGTRFGWNGGLSIPPKLALPKIDHE